MSGEDQMTLNAGEQVTARMVASMRTGMNRVNGVRDAKRSPRDGFDLELDGVGGEMAFAKMQNLCPDLDVLPRSGGHDFTTRKGKTVDVKTTPSEEGDLLVKASKSMNPSDVYVLLTGAFPSYRYRGYALREEVFLETNLVDLGHGPTYKLPQAGLSK